MQCHYQVVVQRLRPGLMQVDFIATLFKLADLAVELIAGLVDAAHIGARCGGQVDRVGAPVSPAAYALTAF